MARVLRLLTIGLPLLALGLAASAEAGTRGGLTVPIRESEAPDARVVQEIELYHESYALVIGIDDYTSGWPRLSMAVKDAKAVAAALETKGFIVTLVTNPNAAELERTLKEFFVIKGEDPQARLFLWYAGHGHTEDGEGYLVPADAPRPTVGAKFRLKALPLRRLGELVRLAKSKHAFAVFDSCFAGTVFGSARAMPPPAVTRATTLTVRQFLSSGDAGQTVSDDGTFRELFIRAITGEEHADANNDGYLTASELGLFLSDRVTNLTQSRQTPRYGKLRDKDYDRGDFVFALPSSGARIVFNPGAKAPTRVQEAEIVFWQSVQDKGNPQMFEAYLERYPKGAFTALARANLGEIEKQRSRMAEEEKARKVVEEEARRRAEEEEARRIASSEAERKRKEEEVRRKAEMELAYPVITHTHYM